MQIISNNIIVFILTSNQTEIINLQIWNDKVFLCYIYWISLNTKSWVKSDGGDRVDDSGLDHPVHQLPLSGEGVELQDFIVVGDTKATIVVTA